MDPYGILQDQLKRQPGMLTEPTIEEMIEVKNKIKTKIEGFNSKKLKYGSKAYLSGMISPYVERSYDISPYIKAAFQHTKNTMSFHEQRRYLFTVLVVKFWNMPIPNNKNMVLDSSVDIIYPNLILIGKLLSAQHFGNKVRKNGTIGIHMAELLLYFDRFCHDPYVRDILKTYYGIPPHALKKFTLILVVKSADKPSLTDARSDIKWFIYVIQERIRKQVQWAQIALNKNDSRHEFASNAIALIDKENAEFVKHVLEKIALNSAFGHFDKKYIENSVCLWLKTLYDVAVPIVGRLNRRVYKTIEVWIKEIKDSNLSLTSKFILRDYDLLDWYCEFHPTTKVFFRMWAKITVNIKAKYRTPQYARERRAGKHIHDKIEPLVKYFTGNINRMFSSGYGSSKITFGKNVWRNFAIFAAECRFIHPALMYVDEFGEFPNKGCADLIRKWLNLVSRKRQQLINEKKSRGEPLRPVKPVTDPSRSWSMRRRKKEPYPSGMHIPVDGKASFPREVNMIAMTNMYTREGTYVGVELKKLNKLINEWIYFFKIKQKQWPQLVAIKFNKKRGGARHRKRVYYMETAMKSMKTILRLKKSNPDDDVIPKCNADVMEAKMLWRYLKTTLDQHRKIAGETHYIVKKDEHYSDEESDEYYSDEYYSDE